MKTIHILIPALLVTLAINNASAANPPAAIPNASPVVIDAHNSATGASQIPEYSWFLAYRPINGSNVVVNPPRFSWPYLPEITSYSRTAEGGDQLPPATFQLSIRREGETTPVFVSPETDMNFYNMIAPLAPGNYSWQVRYRFEDNETTSSPRTFTVSSTAPTWDRSTISEHVRSLSQKPHPRTLPHLFRDREALLKAVMASPDTASAYHRLQSWADTAVNSDWWQDMDWRGDRPPEGWRAVAYIQDVLIPRAQQVTAAALLYRMTGDTRYKHALSHARIWADIREGELLSPEYHDTTPPSGKWGNKFTEYMALVYDWLYDDMSEQDRDAFQRNIAWRTQATMLIDRSWKHPGGGINPEGIAMLGRSHAFQNLYWIIPGLLITSGQWEGSEELLEVVTNFVVGVTISAGPDEGYNEGLYYTNTKSRTLLASYLLMDALMPGVQLGKNPLLPKLGDFIAQLYPLGMHHSASGDFSALPEESFPLQRDNFYYLYRITGMERFMRRSSELARMVKTEELTHQRVTVNHENEERPWLPIMLMEMKAPPTDPAPEPPVMLFPYAGWVMASTGSPSDPQTFSEGMGVILNSRPMGGHGHSYMSENSFQWYAYGAVLNTGGGNTIREFSSAFSRRAIAQSTLLIDGQGQRMSLQAPYHPYCGKIIAFHQGDGFVYWAGDATQAYSPATGVAEWVRHMVFLPHLGLVVYDQIRMQDDAKPARFSWLYHIREQADPEINEEQRTIAYKVHQTQAQVSFAPNTHALEIIDLPGDGQFINHITGDNLSHLSRNFYTPRIDRMAHNLWITNREPARSINMLATYTASASETLPETRFTSDDTVSLRQADGPEITISFNPAKRDATIVIDTASILDAR